MDNKFYVEEPKKYREDFATEEEYLTWVGECDGRRKAFWKEQKQTEEAIISASPHADKITHLESVDRYTVEVLGSGEKYVRMPLTDYLLFKKETGNPIMFEVTPHKSIDHGSYKDLIDDPETIAWLKEVNEFLKNQLEDKDIQFKTSDGLLTWVLEHRPEVATMPEVHFFYTDKVRPDEVMSYDDPMNRTLGFTVPGRYAYITLTDLRKSPPSAEVLEKFGPVPGEILKVIKGDPLRLLCAIEGRDWLATGHIPSPPVDMPDSTPLDEIWAAEAEQSKMLDEGDLGIPRPV